MSAGLLQGFSEPGGYRSKYFFGAMKGSCGFINPQPMNHGVSPSFSIIATVAEAI